MKTVTLRRPRRRKTRKKKKKKILTMLTMMRLAWVKLCLFYGLNRMIVTYDIVMNFSHNDVML